MRGPGGGRDELAIGDGVRDGDVGIRAARQFDFRRAGGIGGNALATDDIGGGQQLRAVAHGGDRLARIGKMAHGGDDFLVQAQVFGRAAAGDHHRVIVGRIDLVEAGVQGEQMARLFRVGLVALEIVDGRLDRLAAFLAGTNGMHGMTEHQQGLEWHHRFIIFCKIAGQKQNFLRCHLVLL